MIKKKKKKKKRKAFALVDHRILLSKLSVYLNSSNSLPFFPFIP